mmetsp:Transcript_150795/g.482653  ORF Transcript_150795/g.482653 Transcript_150795/m.482653 type:complete len:116 (-) Transcript_150795:31-378(-)
MYCGRCGSAVQSLWTLAVSTEQVGRQPGWHRFQNGDLCPLCLRATARSRRARADAEEGNREGLRMDVAGANGTELRRQVPGVDYFPFEAGGGCLLPGRQYEKEEESTHAEKHRIR